MRRGLQLAQWPSEHGTFSSEQLDSGGIVLEFDVLPRHTLRLVLGLLEAKGIRVELCLRSIRAPGENGRRGSGPPPGRRRPAIVRACNISLAKFMQSCSNELVSKASKPKISRMPMKGASTVSPPSSASGVGMEAQCLRAVAAASWLAAAAPTSSLMRATMASKVRP
eukprot:scaffold284340_cov26-Tisochrysis_lutea.AAC.1